MVCFEADQRNKCVREFVSEQMAGAKAIKLSPRNRCAERTALRVRLRLSANECLCVCVISL